MLHTPYELQDADRSWLGWRPSYVVDCQTRDTGCTVRCGGASWSGVVHAHHVSKPPMSGMWSRYSQICPGGRLSWIHHPERCAACLLARQMSYTNTVFGDGCRMPLSADGGIRHIRKPAHRDVPETIWRRYPTLVSGTTPPDSRIIPPSILTGQVARGHKMAAHAGPAVCDSITSHEELPASADQFHARTIPDPGASPP